MFRTFGLLAPKDIYVIWFLLWAYLMKVIPETTLFIMSVPDEGYSRNYSVYYERTWWRLFQKRVVCTKFDIYSLILTSKSNLTESNPTLSQI